MSTLRVCDICAKGKSLYELGSSAKAVTAVSITCEDLTLFQDRTAQTYDLCQDHVFMLWTFLRGAKTNG